jgi:hypothetical protein
MNYKTTIILLSGLIGLSSCVSDKPDVVPEAPVSANVGTGVFILNEGNYTWGNASVSYYRFADGEITVDAFEAANKRPLGDVCQSMEIYNGKGYVVVNNSGKVEVIDPKDFKSVAIINGLTSPRYFAAVSSSKAYVTDLQSSSISVVDLNSNSKIKDIPCTGATEELVIANNKAFVTNSERNYVYVVNPINDLLEDSILVGEYPSSIRQDKNGKLWGGGKMGVLPTLHRINPVTESVEQTFTFSGSKIPWKLDINGTKDTLYFLQNGVYQMPIVNTTLPANPLIAENNSIFYGLGIDPNSSIIYVSDAIDYVQKGKVFRYRSDGILIGSFNADISPGDFCFY